MADVVKVVNGGLAIITNRLKGAGTEPNYIDWGTGGNTAATDTDTVLATPKNDEARVSGTSTQETTTTSNDTYQVVGTVTCETTSGAIDEVGLFDASTSGNMFVRATFDDINVNVGDSIQFTIKVVFDQA